MTYEDLTEKELALLTAVEAGDVGYFRESYRLWTGERDYELVTPTRKSLLVMGLIYRQVAWKPSKGPVALTAAGREVLAHV